MFMDDTIKCARHIKLVGMWSMENQLLCLSYINAHFIILLLMLFPVTNMSKLLSQSVFSMPRNQQVGVIGIFYQDIKT